MGQGTEPGAVYNPPLSAAGRLILPLLVFPNSAGRVRRSAPPYPRLSFDLSSIRRLVIRTSPSSCVHSETMLPTTCPQRLSESDRANSHVHPRPVAIRNIVNE